MSKEIANMKEQELRSLDRWAVVFIVFMSLAPLVPYGLSFGS